MSRHNRYYSQQYSLVEDPAVRERDVVDPSYPLQESRQSTRYTPHNNLEYPNQSSAFTSRDDLDYTKGYSNPPRNTWWTRKRKIWIGSAAAVLVLIAIIVGVAVPLSARNNFTYTPSFAQVNSTEAFKYGGATNNDPNNTQDGIGAGKDEYTYYSGPASNFPNASKWISFEDMWNNNIQVLQNACGVLGYGENNSPEVNQQIYDAIQNRSAVSLVDHRFIFAIILQESHGCVRIPATSNGANNPGIMQSHDGHSYNSQHSALSILAMVQDGTQGTSTGDGLVQDLDFYTTPYAAARAYNSGVVPASGNLSEAAGATACYVSDVANRLTGWVNATSTCHET